MEIEEFIDSSKKIVGDARHRSVYHHTEGVWLCQRIFGVTITVGKKQIPVRLIAERHIIEDLGCLPSPADYIKNMPLAVWMSGAQRKELTLATLGLEKANAETDADGR